MRAHRAYVEDQNVAPSFLPPSHLADRLDVVERDVEDVEVRGTIPPAMSGCLLAFGDGLVHAVRLRGGRVVGSRRARLPASAGRSASSSGVWVFGGRVLVFTDGALAHQLDPDLETSWVVDLAGRSRRLITHPRLDPANGDLHLVATAPDGSYLHAVVPAGSLTRRSRSITDAPSRPVELAVTRDHVLFLCDGFVGVTGHDPEAGVDWIATGVRAPAPVHARDADQCTVLLAVTSSLEQWNVDVGAGLVERHVIDPGRCRSAGILDRAVGRPPRVVWTVGEHSADMYELRTGHRTRHDFGTGRPGDLVFVPDETRAHDPHGGWIAGLVDRGSGAGTDLVVLDASDLDRPAVASVRVSELGSPGCRGAWLPDAAR
jgi:carotenoid cleavage dioxygenase-like enzyme